MLVIPTESYHSETKTKTNGKDKDKDEEQEKKEKVPEVRIECSINRVISQRDKDKDK